MEQNDNIQAIAQLELEQLKAYKEIYIQTDPMPVEPEYEVFNKKDYSFLEVVGVASAGFVAAAVGGIVYSSIRTAGIFVQEEMKQFVKYGWNETLVAIIGFVAAGSIMLTIEGYLAAFGYNHGKQSGRIRIDWWGPGIAFFISALAGLAQSFGLLPETAPGKILLVDGVSWLLVTLSGFGVAALVYYGAENMGVIHSFWNKYLKDRKQEIDNQNKEKHDTFRRELKAWQDRFEEDYRKKGREILFGAGTYTVKRESNRTPQQTNSNGNLGGRISDYLREAGLRPLDIGDGPEFRMKPSALADALNLDKKERTQIYIYLGRLKKADEQGRWN